MEVEQMNATYSVSKLKNLVISGSTFGEEFNRLLKYYENIEKERKLNGVSLECYVILLYITGKLREIEVLRNIYKVTY
jgi:hypothetical protein